MEVQVAGERHLKVGAGIAHFAGDGIPVAVTCRVLKIARQPYYRWLAAPVTDREWNDAHLANALFDAHRDDPEFGYRFLADEARLAGHDLGLGSGHEDAGADRHLEVAERGATGQVLQRDPAAAKIAQWWQSSSGELGTGFPLSPEDLAFAAK